MIGKDTNTSWTRAMIFQRPANKETHNASDKNPPHFCRKRILIHFKVILLASFSIYKSCIYEILKYYDSKTNNSKGNFYTKLTTRTEYNENPKEKWKNEFILKTNTSRAWNQSQRYLTPKDRKEVPYHEEDVLWSWRSIITAYKHYQVYLNWSIYSYSVYSYSRLNFLIIAQTQIEQWYKFSTF